MLFQISRNAGAFNSIVTSLPQVPRSAYSSAHHRLIQQRRFFFGRQEIIENLYARIAAPDHSLTVVLGVSGSGKSSLVKAGLIPYLRELSKPPINDRHQWHILNPIRPGESPFAALARTIWAIADMPITVQLDSLGFLSEKLNQKTKQLNTQVAEASSKHGETSRTTQRLKQEAEKFAQITLTWNQDTHAAKQLLIVEHFETLYALCQTEGEAESQQQQQLKHVFLACLNPLTEQLQSAPNSLVEIVNAWSQKHPGVNLLLVIDQFEELITLTRKAQPTPQSNTPEEWQQFLQLLETTLAATLPQLRIIATLRSDFEPRFLNSEALNSYWTRARFPVRAMRSDELRQAIEGPASEMALYFEPANLVDRLIDEVGQMPGALPLLSFTLSEFYIKLAQKWRDGESSDRALTIDAEFDQEGGVAGSLTRRANEEYRKIGDELDEAAQQTMRRVMLRMLTLEGGETARRRVPESELVYPTQEESDRVKQVVDQLVEARLLVKGQLETGEPYVEPAHDFLVRGWKKLQDWISEEQGNLDLQQRLTPQAIDWHKNNQDTEYLWIRDPRLALLEKLLESKTDNWLNQLEIEFVQSSRNKRLDELEETKERLRISEERRIEAVSRQLSAQAELLQSQQPHLLERSVLVAIEAIKYRHSLETDRVLKQGLSLLPLPLTTLKENDKSCARSITFSPDSQYLAVGFDDTVQVWKWDTAHPTFISKLEHKTQIPPPEGSSHKKFYVYQNIFIDCNYLITISYESFSNEGYSYQTSAIWLWRLADNQLVSVQTIPAILDFDFNVNKKVLTTVSDTHNVNILNKVFVWEFADGAWQRIYELPHQEHIWQLSVSSDSKLSAFAYEGKVVYQERGNQHYKVIQQKNVRELLFSPDGKYLVTKVEDITNRRCNLHIWNLADEQEINRISQNYTLHSLVFSPDGEYLAAGSRERITYVWKVKTGEEVARIKHQQYAHQVSFSPVFKYGKYLLATATDTAQLWQLDWSPQVMSFAHNAIENETIHKGILFDAELSPDGKYLATAGEDKTVIVWEVITGKMVVALHDSHPIKTVSFSPDGDYLVTATDFQSLIWEWKENTEEPLKCIEHSHCSIFSTNGKYIATASGNIVKIWDWVNDKVIRELSHQDQVTSLAFNTKTELIVAGSMKGITIVWEILTGRQVKQLLPYKTVN